MLRIPKYLRALTTVILLTISGGHLYAGTDAPRREIRSAWVTTAWAIDWPSNKTDEATQKSEAITILDNLKAMGANCVFFQVRSMNDRYYNKNSYTINGTTYTISNEKRSTYLAGTTWDPLQYWLDAAHARGMELYAWINPYRVATTQATYDQQGLPDNMKSWIMKSKASSTKAGVEYTDIWVYNPALSQTKARITNICRVLAGNYDIDGIVFDDYFYPDRISIDDNNNASPDQAQYNSYRSGGGTLPLADWRRKNINDMVSQVNEAIHAVKPWVKFGISPAGVAFKGLANFADEADTQRPLAFGVDTDDWQYDGIFSDPIHWVHERTVDFISPQIYWQYYDKPPFKGCCEWWTRYAKKHDVHFYASHSVSYVVFGANDKYNGQAGYDYEKKKIDCVRKEGTENGTPFGSVYYSMRGLKDGLRACMAADAYKYKALPPEYTRHGSNEARGADPGKVAKLTATLSSGNVTKLSWTAKAALSATQGNGSGVMRYTVYAIPSSVYPEDAIDADGGIQAQYLLGMTYSASMDIPSDKRTGCYYAVCCFDRHGHEWAPVYYGEIPVRPDPLANPILFKPDNNTNITDATNFVASYVTDDPSLTELQIFDNAECQGTPVLSSTVWNEVPDGKGDIWLQHLVTPFDLSNGRYWWRVYCTRRGVPAVTSETRTFTIGNGITEKGYLTEGGYTPRRDLTTDFEVTLANGKRADVQSLWIRKSDISPFNDFGADGSIRDICVRPADSDQVRDIVYLSSKDGVAHLKRLDARTGENIGDITLNFDANWTGGTYTINGVCIDNKNRLYVHSLAAANAKFLVGVITDLDEENRTATVKTLLSYSDPTFRFDHARVYGDLMEGTGYIMAVTRSSDNTNRAFRWTVNKGTVNPDSKVSANLGTFAGIVPYIHPVSESRLLVKASHSAASSCHLVDVSTGNIIGTASAISNQAGGVTAFRHGGSRFIVAPARDHKSTARATSGMAWGIYSVKDPAGDISGEVLVNEMPSGDYMGTIQSASADYGAPVVFLQTGNGKASATGIDNPTTTYIYGLCNQNGIAAYKLTSRLATGAEDIVTDSTDDDEAQYYNLQGVRISGNRPLAPGIYIRRTPTATTKVIMQ